MGDPDHLERATGVSRPGVQPGLDVDVVVAGPGLLDDVGRVGAGTEVIGQDPRQPGPVLRPRRPGRSSSSACGPFGNVTSECELYAANPR
jgi:hypothetical protein